MKCNKAAKPDQLNTDKFEAYAEQRKSRGKRRHSSSGSKRSDVKWFDKMN